MTGDTTLLDLNTLSMNAPPQILGHSPMMSFFSPVSVALIGATDREGSVGATTLRNLRQSGYKGRVHAVNPKRTEIFGAPCYPAIAAIPDAIELVDPTSAFRASLIRRGYPTFFFHSVRSLPRSYCTTLRKTIMRQAI